jgi:hypothetical protein
VFRQYKAVEPAHRLVARPLERQGEVARAAAESLRAASAPCLAHHPATLSAQDREALRRLAAEMPAVWHAPPTPPAPLGASLPLARPRRRPSGLPLCETAQGVATRVERRSGP